MLPTRDETRRKAQESGSEAATLQRRFSHTSFGLAAFATNPDLSQIAAGSTFVDPQLAVLRSAIILATVNEAVPVNVSDMTTAASPHKPDRHDSSLLAVAVDELAASESLSMHEHSGAAARFRGVGFNILRDKPLWELKAVNSC